MRSPRDIDLGGDALASLGQILGIMTDQVLAGEGRPRWELDELMALEVRLGIHTGIDDLPGIAATEGRTVTLDIGDVALLLDGMAFTEIASVELPWFEMVQWTADFITGELRRHWTEEEWRAYSLGA